MKKNLTFQNILLFLLIVFAAYRFTLSDNGEDITEAETALAEKLPDRFSETNLITESNTVKTSSGNYILEALCRSNRYVFKVSETGINPNYENMFGEVMTDALVIDDGMRVLQARKNINKAGLLCKNITGADGNAVKDLFRQDSRDISDWSLKPVMRINKSDFSPDDTTKVVSLTVINYKGDTISTDTLRIRDFGNRNNEYTGQYTDSYSFINLVVSGRPDTSAGLSYGMPEKTESKVSGKTDIQVYWFGLADVWFEKMIVDDRRADELFGKDYMGNHDQKIKDAATPENYLLITSIIRQNNYTMSNIQPINYVLNVMHDELVRKNLAPKELASAY